MSKYRCTDAHAEKLTINQGLERFKMLSDTKYQRDILGSVCA